MRTADPTADSILAGLQRAGRQQAEEAAGGVRSLGRAVAALPPGVVAGEWLGKPRSISGGGGGTAMYAFTVAGAVRWNLPNAPAGCPGNWLGAPPPDHETEGAYNCLRIPYDGVEEPTYITETTYLAVGWTSMPSESGTDPRANALYVKISECPGPVFPVLRA